MSRTTSRRPATVRDPGLQAERTTLAWSRTALALAGASLLLGRALAVRFSASVVIFAALGALTVAVAIHAAHRRYRRWASTDEATHRPGASNLALVGTVVALGAAMLAVMLF